MDTDVSTRRRRGAEVNFLEKHDARKRHRTFAFGQFRWVRGVVDDPVVTLELVEAAALWRIIERDGVLVFALGEAFAPERHRRGVSDPHLAQFRIEFVAQAEGDDFVAPVKDKELVVLAASWGIGVVRRHDLRERIAPANSKVGHGGTVP